MISEITLSPEWNLQPPHIVRFAQEVGENFAFLASFVGSVHDELLQMKLSQERLVELEQNSQIALNTALEAEFQSEQSVGYLKIQLETLENQLEENNKTYNRRLDELDRCIEDQGRVAHEVHSERIKDLENGLEERESELQQLRDDMASELEESHDLMKNYGDQAKYFFEKQTIYSEDFIELRKNMVSSSEKISRLGLEIDQKFQNFEQNYFVSLTARILECEGKIQKSETFSSKIETAHEENHEQIRSLLESAQYQRAEVANTSETLSELKNEIEQIEHYYIKTETETSEIERKVNVFRADLGDLIDQEVIGRQAESADLNAAIRQISERIGDLQDELLCKINFCNDFAVNSGLQREFNAARRQQYEDGLDGIFTQGCLEVGQETLLKAVTLRLRELESRVMQFIARSTEPEQLE